VPSPDPEVVKASGSGDEKNRAGLPPPSRGRSLEAPRRLAGPPGRARQRSARERGDTPKDHLFVPHSSRIRPAYDRETSSKDANDAAIKRAGQKHEIPPIAQLASVDPGNTLKEETAHLLLIPTRRVRQGRISLIRWLRPTRAMPPHPPNGIGDGGQLDAREDLSPRSATHTTSSLVPEGKPRLRSAWPDVAPGTSTLPASSSTGPCIVSTRIFLRADTPSDRGVHHACRRNGNFRCREVVARTDNSRGANRRRDLASSRRSRNRRGITAGHISSRRARDASTPATCAFAAPGVGLEPTTYGLTV